DEFKLTVPAKALRELEKMIAMQPDAKNIRLHGDEGQIIFILGDDESEQSQILTCRSLDGQYPNYRQLIPNQFDKQVTVDRKELISSLERIAVLTDQKNSLVKFSLNSENQQIYLSVDTQDVGSGKEDLSAQISGEDMDIAFNVKYMLEGLKAFPSTEIQLRLNNPTGPVIITPLSGLQMTYLVMPVQIRK
ncbi:MAG TPA: DNA polymerase III subunit beta, partial [Allocoleopsis sp.]